MRSLLEFISLLVLILFLFSAYSFAEYQASIFGVEIKKTETKSFFSPPKLATKTLKNPIALRGDSIQKKENKLDTSAQRILLIGDSMLEGLMRRLKDYCAFNDHEIKTVIWYGSTTEVFGKSDTLAHFIKQFKPTYILLSLGANELFVRKIKERRQVYVDSILQELDTIPFAWIGPPNWKEDTGINELIIENIGVSKYFESKKLSFERSADGMHPTHYSAGIWMDSIASWVQRDSEYRIKMNLPDKTYKKSANVTLLRSGH